MKLVFLVFLLSYAGIATAESSLPVGQRVYVDTGNLWEPLQIVPLGENAKGVLDPNLVSDEAPKKVMAPVRKPKAKAAKNSSLVFDEVRIRGRLNKPRVKFGRTRLDIGRIDQRPNTDRFNRIFQVKAGDL